MVSQKLLLELKEIMEQDYGIKLTMAEVTEVAMTLIGFCRNCHEDRSQNEQLLAELKVTKVNFNVKTKQTTNRQPLPSNLERSYL